MSKGYEILAQALKDQQIKYCFGIVGVPVIELGIAIQGQGIEYYGFRNEQGAAYSAGAIGYLTKTPGVVLAVSGPGFTNCISGLANAQSNGWPMICIAGSSFSYQQEQQAFQEIDQVSAAKQFCKLSFQIKSVQQIPYLIEKAVRFSVSGRPGPVYIDVPGDVLEMVAKDEFQKFTRFNTDLDNISSNENILKVIQALREVFFFTKAKSPLIIVGKGAAYNCAENEVNEFIQLTDLPFLPTPMGKGVVSDFHKNNVNPQIQVIAARSRALSQADCIVLLGARLNWILHFGLPPRFSSKVKIIQFDICSEEFGQTLQNSIPVQGNINQNLQILNNLLKTQNQPFKIDQWRQSLNQKIKENEIQQKILVESKTLIYYSAYGIIRKNLPKDHILINEGANTMDIGRTMMNHEKPRRRLDAGTFGTMGIGLPFCVAAKCANKKQFVVAVMGDSAFGFSCMELDVLVRYQLPCLVIILNNNGIYSGVEELEDDRQSSPVTSLNPQARYEKIAEALGGQGFYVKTTQELEQVMPQAVQVVQKGTTCVVNIMIDPYDAKKPQEFGWLTKDAKL